MSPENIELARSGFEAWNRGDLEAWIETFDGECEFWPLRAQLDGRPYRGHDGLRQFARDMTEEWEHLRFEVNEIRDTGEHVVALAHFDARGRASGVELHLPVGALAMVRGGKIVQSRIYSDPAEAFQAAGLSE